MLWSTYYVPNTCWALLTFKSTLFLSSKLSSFGKARKLLPKVRVIMNPGGSNLASNSCTSLEQSQTVDQ